MPSARNVAKKWIDEVSKSRVLNEASLESKKSALILKNKDMCAV